MMVDYSREFGVRLYKHNAFSEHALVKCILSNQQLAITWYLKISFVRLRAE